MSGGHERDEDRGGGNRLGLHWMADLIVALVAFGGLGTLTGLWAGVLMGCH